MKDSLFLDIATRVAKESKCISMQVGAVIVKDDRIISMGYNGTVAGSINCNEAFKRGDFNRDEHSAWSDSHEIHAEMNALMFAVKNGLPVDGCTLYCTHEPCDQCLKNIIQAGIKRIVYINPYKKERCKSKYRYDGSIEMVQYVSDGRNEIYDKIRTYIYNQYDRNEDVPDINEQSRFYEDIGWDSLDCVEGIMELEEEYSTRIPDDDWWNWTCIKDAVDYIYKLKNK